mgnify:CR=1 FL=1
MTENDADANMALENGIDSIIGVAAAPASASEDGAPEAAEEKTSARRKERLSQPTCPFLDVSW